jgi:hypothetical protein
MDLCEEFDLEADDDAFGVEDVAGILYAQPITGNLSIDPDPLPSLVDEPSLPVRAAIPAQPRGKRGSGWKLITPFVTLMTNLAIANHPGHALADVAAATRRPTRVSFDPVPVTEPAEGDETDDLYDDHYFAFLSEQWSDPDVSFAPSVDPRDPSTTPSPPHGGVREVDASSDLFTFVVTGATPDNVGRPLAEEIESYDWGGTDERFVAGAHPTPFHLWERELDMESFFSGRAASFQESQPPSLDISAILARPDDSFTFAEVGSKWGYSAGDFEFLLKGDRSNLKRFAVLAVTHDNPPAARPPPEPPDSRLELASIPRSTPPVSTEPDEPFAGSAVGSVPPQFQGTFPFYSVFNDPEGARARVELWESEFAADNERCRAELAAGRKPKAKFRRVELFSSNEFHPYIAGRQVNCLDHDRCFVETDHDRPREEGVGIDWRSVVRGLGGVEPEPSADGTIDWAAAVRNHPYPDRRLLSDLMLGFHNKSRQPWCLVLSPYNGSAAAGLPVVEKAVDKGLKNGHLIESSGISALPMVTEPYGIAYKRHTHCPVHGAKPRLTTDRSGPRDLVDPVSGLPIADNANVDVKTDWPSMKLVTVPLIRQGLAILSAGSDRLASEIDDDKSLDEAERERRKREVGQVHMACEDFAGFFSQFHVRDRMRSRNGMCFVREDGRLSYNYSTRVTFGGSTAPQFAQRFTNAVLDETQTRLREEDRRLEEHAVLYEEGLEGGHAFAALLAPPSLRELVATRRNLRGDEQASLYFLDGYIDDVIMAAPGQARTLLMLNTLWSVCDQFNVKLAPDKASFGTRCTVLGFDFKLKSNLFSLTDNRHHLFAAWFRRLRGLRGRRVARAELRALAGSLVWARPALPGSGHFYRRLFGLLNAPTRTLIQPPWLEFDLDQLEDILNETEGEDMIRSPPPVPSISPAQMLWTDAAREQNQPSAMGGFTTATGQLWKWTFDDQHVRHLPIHVLEAIGSVTALALAANTLRGQSLVVYCDNQAWVKSVQRGTPADPRLKEILAVHNQICREYDLTVHLMYVHTDTNIVADAASRHRTEEAISELESKGWAREDVRVLDLNTQPHLGPSDLSLLLDRMVQITVARTLFRKKLREHTWAA